MSVNVSSAALRAGPPARPTDAPPGIFLPAKPCGTLPAGLDMISGIAASRRHPGVLFCQNDHGQPLLYAIGPDAGLLATFELPGVRVEDWGAISAGPGHGGEPFVYIGDVGDNLLNRGSVEPSIALYRFPEPGIGPSADSPASAVPDWQKIVLAYPDGPHNSEAFLIDPLTGDLVVIIKDNASNHGLDRSPDWRADAERIRMSRTYTATAGELDRAATDGCPQVMRRSADITTTVNATQSGLASGATITPDGRWLLVKNAQEAFMWYRGDGVGVPDLFGGQPSAPYYLPLAVDPPAEQPGLGQALGWALDGSGFYTAKGNNPQQLWFFGLDTRMPKSPTSIAVAPVPGKPASAVISWTPPARTETLTRYEVHDQGVLSCWVHAEPRLIFTAPGASTVLASTTTLATSVRKNNLDMSTEHAFTVTSVDLLGRSSMPSDALHHRLPG